MLRDVYAHDSEFHSVREDGRCVRLERKKRPFPGHILCGFVQMARQPECVEMGVTSKGRVSDTHSDPLD